MGYDYGVYRGLVFEPPVRYEPLPNLQRPRHFLEWQAFAGPLRSETLLGHMLGNKTTLPAEVLCPHHVQHVRHHLA